jgi:hypothetical protein
LECYKNAPVGGEKCTCCGRFSDGAAVEDGAEVGAEVDGVEDEIVLALK